MWYPTETQLNQDDDWRRCTKLIHQSTVECHVSGWRDTPGDRAIPGGQDKLLQNGGNESRHSQHLRTQFENHHQKRLYHFIHG